MSSYGYLQGKFPFSPFTIWIQCHSGLEYTYLTFLESKEGKISKAKFKVQDT